MRALTERGAQHRWPQGIPTSVQQQLDKELALIADLHYEHYFLTVEDLVRFARSRGILCQGRGSAANSVVCYALHVTEVDPVRVSMLFERFLSKERAEPPDIDIDFEHQRREEVIQYIYQKYGRAAGRTGRDRHLLSPSPGRAGGGQGTRVAHGRSGCAGQVLAVVR